MSWLRWIPSAQQSQRHGDGSSVRRPVRDGAGSSLQPGERGPRARRDGAQGRPGFGRVIPVPGGSWFVLSVGGNPDSAINKSICDNTVEWLHF